MQEKVHKIKLKVIFIQEKDENVSKNQRYVAGKSPILDANCVVLLLYTVRNSIIMVNWMKGLKITVSLQKKGASKNNSKITNTFIYKITPIVNTSWIFERSPTRPSDSKGTKYAE